MNEYCDMLDAALKRKNMTRKDFEQKMGWEYTSKYLYDLLPAGSRPITMYAFIKITEVLDLDLYALFVAFKTARLRRMSHSMDIRFKRIVEELKNRKMLNDLDPVV